MHVSILIPQEGALLNSIERLYNIFNHANYLVTESSSTPVFTIQLIGADKRIILHGGFSIKPNRQLENAIDSNLIIIPALAGDIENGIKNNSAFYSFIKDQYIKGAGIAALCTGAFFLKRLNFTSDNDCVMNWFVDETFRKQYMQVSMATENLMKRETVIYNKLGAYTFIDKLIRKQAGSEAAANCAFYFEQEFNTECQSLVSVNNKKNNPLILNSTFSSSKPQPKEITKQSFAAMFELECSRDADEHLKKETARRNNNKVIRQLLKK